MPVYTVPSHEGSARLRDLVDELDKAGEPVITVLDREGSFVVVTSPMSSRARSAAKRPAAKKETR